MEGYLDCNATTPLDERVFEAMAPYLQGIHGNPSSVHRFGRQARAGIDQAREQVAALVGVAPGQVIFTSGGTEANNLALWASCMDRAPGALVISAIEHASLREPAQAWTRRGWRLHELPVSADGVVETERLAPLLAARPALVSVMLANNETGAVQPVAALAEQCRAAGVVMHSDAVQAAGKLVFDFAATGVQLMSLSSHKIYGPKGVGALVYDKALELNPMLVGGGQERGLRAGTENVAGIVGFGKAAELALAERVERIRHMRALRDHLESRLAGLPEIRVLARGAPRLPNTVQLLLPGMEGATLLMELDRGGIAVSSGSACAAGKTQPSHVLLAMGVDEASARGAVRVSFGKDTTREEVDRLVDLLAQQAARLSAASGAIGW